MQLPHEDGVLVMSLSGECAGCIKLNFFDRKTNEVVPLGFFAFKTEKQLLDAWGSIPDFVGHTEFGADWLDNDMDIVDDRPISAEACEKLMKRPIAELIDQGRAFLKLMSS